eukprot:5171191-Amphidinium_carterae.1
MLVLSSRRQWFITHDVDPMTFNGMAALVSKCNRLSFLRTSLSSQAHLLAAIHHAAVPNGEPRFDWLKLTGDPVL